MEFDKHKSAGYLANHMARLFAAGLHARIKSLGLAPAQFMTLLELWSEDGLTQKELVYRLDVEQATMANTLSRMERDGLIERRPHPNDARAQSIYLTVTAKRLKAPATQAAKEQNQVALSGFTDKEKKSFISLMSKAIEAMKNE